MNKFIFSKIEIASIIVILIWYIFSILLCFETYKFWKERKSKIIKTRHPILSITFISLVLLCFKLFII